MKSKTVEQSLLERRSVRRYERETIGASDMEFIYEAIRNTPTSYNGQQYSVIDIDDQAVKEQLYELTQQKQIKTCSHFLLFCADYNKIQRVADAKGIDMPRFYDTMDGVVVGVVDATLAMMSAVVAAESRGLGTCCIGYARTAAPDAVARLLGLPRGVFAVCGLAIGVPREQPDMKPKQPVSLIIHHNGYRNDSMVPEMLDYDATVRRYNETRSGDKTSNDWVEHILGYYHEAMNYDMLAALSRRGFDIIS